MAWVPTAPETMPTLKPSIASVSRSFWRIISSHQRANLRPIVIGSACTPWVRPMASVSLYWTAFSAKAAMALSSSVCSREPASISWRFRPVSNMSLEVIPRWSQRPSGPMDSVMEEMNAVTSWRVVSNSSIMRLWSYFAPRSLTISPFGITPSLVHASQTANSTSSHLRYLFSSDQTCFMAGLEYRSITGSPPHRATPSDPCPSLENRCTDTSIPLKSSKWL